MFEDIKAAFNAALDAAIGDQGPSTSLMRDAVIEARAAIKYMEEGLEKSSRKLARESRNLEDAERRGRLASEIGDGETVRIAEKFAAKHREKVEVLTRKVEAQKAELEIARRDVGEMTRQLKAAQRGGPGVSPGASASSHEADSLGATMDRDMKESFAERQLEELKRKMGK